MTDEHTHTTIHFVGGGSVIVGVPMRDVQESITPGDDGWVYYADGPDDQPVTIFTAHITHLTPHQPRSGRASFT